MLNKTRMIATPDSSQVAEFGYIPAQQVLLVRFRAGGLYAYYGVDQTVFWSLYTSASVGKALNEEVKQGGYRYERVAELPSPATAETEVTA